MQIIGIIFVITLTVAWATSMQRTGIRGALYLLVFGIGISLLHWPVSMLLGDPYSEVLTLEAIGIGYSMLVVAGYPAILVALGNILYEVGILVYLVLGGK